ncbi:MAG: hypothetical protein H0X71_05940 [Rubrobacter sp.]|nr:hypothetical protein [Rubrobacter sp.]
MDNSTQNYFDHREELREAYRTFGEDGLHIEVDYDAEKSILIVHDNAYGMEIEELTRALVLDSPPPNRSGRSEFGMGLIPFRSIDVIVPPPPPLPTTSSR